MGPYIYMSKYQACLQSIMNLFMAINKKPKNTFGGFHDPATTYANTDSNCDNTY